jgi:glycosyltransferase involved in cell wall biosynthesis
MVAGQYRLAITHGYGGGADAYLDARIRRRKPGDSPWVVTTPGGPFVRLATGLSGNSRGGWVTRTWFLDRVLDQPPTLILLNGLQGWAPFRQVIETLVATPSVVALELALHDFLPICPSYNLLGAAGTFCDVPPLTQCSRCFPEIAGVARQEFDAVDDWRREWEKLLSRVDAVTTFSWSSAETLRSVFPGAHASVKPHGPPARLRAPRQNLERSELPKVGVFGVITDAKGAGLLVRTAAEAARRGHLIEWHVFGSLAVKDPFPTIKVHGKYATDEMPLLVERFGISAAVLPSIVPETFSFVADELASMRMPFAAFPLGAPHERLGKSDLVFFADRVTPVALLDATLRAIEAGWTRFGGGNADAMSPNVADDPATGLAP